MVTIGLHGNAQACIVLGKAALYALLMVWQKAGLAEAIAAQWVSDSNQKGHAGSQRHGQGPQLFFNDVVRVSDEVYDVHNDGAYGASPVSLSEAEATILPSVCQRNIVVQPHTCAPCTCATALHSSRRSTCRPQFSFATSVALV